MNNCEWINCIILYLKDLISSDGIRAAIVSSTLTFFATMYVQRKLHLEDFEGRRKLLLVGFKTDLESLKELFKICEGKYKEYLKSGQSDVDVNPYNYFNFPVKYNYVVFYENNIGNMGLLRDEFLTKQIIKTYLCIKSFYEDLGELYKFSQQGIELSVKKDNNLNLWMRERHKAQHEECFRVLQNVYKEIDEVLKMINADLEKK